LQRNAYTKYTLSASALQPAIDITTMAHIVDGDLPDVSINSIDNAIISDTNPIPLLSPR